MSHLVCHEIGGSPVVVLLKVCRILEHSWRGALALLRVEAVENIVKGVVAVGGFHFNLGALIKTEQTC
jgi:hypothetical protein